MKKLCCIILCIILSCAACAPQSVHPEAVAIPTVSIMPEPTPFAHSQENAYLPDTTRVGYYPENPKILSGSDLTKQDILTLYDVVQAMEWESLAKVFSAFGIVLDAACDIRMCDLTHFDSDLYEIRTAKPVFEANDIAHMSIASKDGNYETEFVITFIQKQEDKFSPCSIITLSNDYYCDDPHYGFEEIGGRLWLILRDDFGHGTGFYSVGEEWYDVETGQQLLYFTTEYSDTDDYEWLEDFTQKTQLSHEAVMQGNNGDFYLEVNEETIPIPKGAENGETYSSKYKIFFDKQNMKMYEQGYQWRQVLDHFTQSKNEYIRDWAQERIRRLENPDSPQEEVINMPDKSDMFALQNTKSPAFSFIQLNSKSVTKDQLYSLCNDINTQSRDSLSDIFIDYGIAPENSDEIKDLLWNHLQDVSCVVDNRTAYEREIYINMNYTYQNERKGLLLIAIMDKDTDQWHFSEALLYSLPNSRTVSVYFLGPGKRIVYLPGEDKNGKPSTTACFQNDKMKFFFISESYGADGLHYICDIDRLYKTAINEFCRFYVDVKDANDDSMAYMSTHIWLPPDGEALFSTDDDLSALLIGDFEQNELLMDTLNQRTPKAETTP